MAFSPTEDDARLTAEWRDFLAAEHELYAAAGLPGTFHDRNAFDHFLMHGFAPMPGGLADGVAFHLDELRPDQRQELGHLVSRYLARFEDPGIAQEIRLLTP